MNSSSVPLISVVLPVYNVEKYIRECLQSIFDQTIQDFEIIIIDDCSTDNTLNEINFFKDNRIKIMKKSQNKGLIDSLNQGLITARGKYVARMDGDDVCLPKRFEKQLDFLEKNPAVILCGTAIKIIGDCRLIVFPEFNEEIKAKFLLRNCIAHPTVMFRKSVILKNNIVYDVDMKHTEDYALWVKLLSYGRLHNLQDCLLSYRIHEKQVSTQFKETQLLGDINIKFSLFKKLEYNQNYFTDSLITKILYTNESFNKYELKTVLEWFEVLKKNNSKFKIFDKKHFLKVIHEIELKLIYEIFFTNRKQNLNYQLRRDFLKIIPLRFKIYVINKKIIEKFKVLKHKIV